MTCPICKETELIVQNGHYFCPSCKIYTSKVDSSQAQSPTQSVATTQAAIQEPTFKDSKLPYYKKYF